MPANAEQDKASLPLMSDCTDNLLAGSAARQKRCGGGFEAINDARRALAFDVDRAERCSPERRTSACTELSDLERRHGHALPASARLKPLEWSRLVACGSKSRRQRNSVMTGYDSQGDSRIALPARRG
jgi:hypothetical protein